jgi:hypothetical protein
MRGGLFAAVVVAVGAMALGCGGTMREAAAPEEEGTPLRNPPRPAAPAPPAEEPEPEPPAPGEATTPCPLQWTPRELRGGVLTLPAELYGRMMVPLVRALCACTRPEQSLAVVTRLVPDHGEVTAVTADRPEQHARASRGIDACLARELGAGRFQPFHVGSDLVLECDPPRGPAAPRQPGQPLHLAAPRRADCVPEEERFAILTVPLYVDRRDER